MARHWSPRRVVECGGEYGQAQGCGWEGLRTAAMTSKPCPKCGGKVNKIDGDILTPAQRTRLDRANRRG